MGVWSRLVGRIRRAFFGRIAPAPPPAPRPTQGPNAREDPSSDQAGQRKTSPRRDTGKPQSHSQPRPIHINLGIDFGTSFTKICFRDVGADYTRVVCLGGNTIEGALIPSIVAIDQNGRLTLPGANENSGTRLFVRHLKMRLAGERIGEPPSNFAGYDLTDARVVRALAAWYLATLIQRSQKWIRDNERGRLKGRPIRWSANVCVPVEHCDSPVIDVFNDVLAAAWFMARSGDASSDLQDVLASFDSARLTAAREPADCHAIPEIAAAVHPFVFSRSAQADKYIYFDIGGGTIDGVAFRLNFDHGSPRVAFYSGRIGTFGVEALAHTVKLPDGASLIEALKDCSDQPAVQEFAHQIQLLVAQVVVAAKKKDGMTWQVRASGRPNNGPLLPHQMKELPVFIGGGGARIAWYGAQINDTYETFRHDRAEIPPYGLREIPKPTELDMSGLPATEFNRFAIAYGLSIPLGEGPEIVLPSKVGAAPKPPMRTIKGIVDYEDSKDAYD